MRKPPTYKRDLADRLLQWLNESGTTSWPRGYIMLAEASQSLKETIPDLWAGYDLLLALGRIERNNPNGKEGARVVDFRPLCLPAKPLAGGLVVIKLPKDRLRAMTSEQVFSIRKTFPNDQVIFLEPDDDLLTGTTAGKELVRVRDQITLILKKRKEGE